MGRYNNRMIATDESLQRLTTVPSEQEAAIIVAVLIAEGIDACCMGETTANFRVGVPGKIHVYVSAGEVERARRIFEEREAAALESLTTDNDEADTASGWMWKALVLLALFLLLLIGMGGSGR
jgi:uncharacterized membrane protein